MFPRFTRKAMPLAGGVRNAMFTRALSNIMISTTDTIPNTRTVQTIGLVEGNTVRAKFVGRDIIASIKQLFGGEISEYTELQRDSRAEAVQRMTEQAESLGANAIVGVRIIATNITPQASEVLAYGTAVRLEY